MGDYDITDRNRIRQIQTRTVLMSNDPWCRALASEEDDSAR